MQELSGDILAHIGKYSHIEDLSKQVKLTSKNKWSIIKSFTSLNDDDSKITQPSVHDINIMYNLVTKFKLDDVSTTKKLIKLKFSYEPFINYIILESYHFEKIRDVLELSYTEKNEPFIKCLQEVIISKLYNNIPQGKTILEYYNDVNSFNIRSPLYEAQVICLIDTKNFDVLNPIRYCQRNRGINESVMYLLTSSCFFLLYHRQFSDEEQKYLFNNIITKRNIYDIHDLACIWKQEDKTMWNNFVEGIPALGCYNKLFTFGGYTHRIYDSFMRRKGDTELYHDTIKNYLKCKPSMIYCYCQFEHRYDLDAYDCDGFRYFMKFILRPFTDKELSDFVISNEMLKNILKYMCDYIMRLNRSSAIKVLECIQVFDFSLFRYLTFYCKTMIKLLVNMILPEDSADPDLVNMPEHRDLGRCHINIDYYYPSNKENYTRQRKYIQSKKEAYLKKRSKCKN